MPPAEFWNQTLAGYRIHMTGAMTRIRRTAEARAEAIRAQAWMTAALTRAARMPDFRQFTKGQATRRQTADEMLAIAKGMSAYFAGVYGKPH